MAGVAKKGSTFAQSIASGHVSYSYYVYTEFGSYLQNGTTNGKISGTCNASDHGVFVNGVNPVLNGDSTQETETYDPFISNNPYVSSGFNYQYHPTATGSVSSGNNNNVYIGGKLVAINGSSIRTHAGSMTTINQGSENVYIGG